MNADRNHSSFMKGTKEEREKIQKKLYPHFEHVM